MGSYLCSSGSGVPARPWASRRSSRPRGHRFLPLTAVLGVWAGPAVFLAICPVGIALTRVVTSRAVGDGAYSFYRAAF